MFLIYEKKSWKNKVILYEREDETCLSSTHTPHQGVHVPEDLVGQWTFQR